MFWGYICLLRVGAAGKNFGDADAYFLNVSKSNFDMLFVCIGTLSGEKGFCFK